MAFTLPELPYPKNALQPHISEETLEYHYGKHHKAYVDKLNQLVEGTDYASMSLEDIIRKSEGAVFNNAAQVWNHTFFWNCMSPKGGGDPTGPIAEELSKAFGSVGAFKSKFSEAAIGQFGSGWAWLVQRNDGSLAIEALSNAGNPMTKDLAPLMTLDVWEHAYYIDYRNARPKFVEAFWNLVNWDFVNQNLKS